MLFSIPSAVRNAKKVLCGPSMPMSKFKQYGIDRIISVAKPLRCAKSYCFDSRSAIAITTSELRAGLKLAGSSSRAVEVLPIELRDVALSL